MLPADFAHFSCDKGEGAKRSDYWLTKRSGGISSPVLNCCQVPGI